MIPGGTARRDESILATNDGEQLSAFELRRQGLGRKPHEWGVEITPIGVPGSDDMAVRITLIDRDTGKRVGSRTIPWVEFRDCAHGTFLTNIAEGVHT